MKKYIRFVRILNRAKRVSEIARNDFWMAATSCATVSRFAPELCFAIYRVGPFGAPKVAQITRPDTVILSERANCIIIRDGYIYELFKRK